MNITYYEDEIQEIASDNNLGLVKFETRLAHNTGKYFKAGYVTIGKRKELFCKQDTLGDRDKFYLCNEFRKINNTD